MINPYFSSNGVEIFHGDCRDVVPQLDATFTACVTDPPYHLTQASRNGSPRQNDPATPFGRTRLGSAGFMGKTWDGGDVGQNRATWAALLAVVKPGAHLLAFGGTRTFHRMMCAIEDAGWGLRDTLMWLYGEGFPKSLDLSEKFMGYGTSLKPAWEPIVAAMRPLDGTFAANAEKHGVAGLNIDAARIQVRDGAYAKNCSGDRGHDGTRPIEGRGATDLRPGGGKAAPGRWPANLVLSHADDCRCVGTTKVKAAPGGTRDRNSTLSEEYCGEGGGGFKGGRSTVSHADIDGLETVEQWECSPSCPVRLLDEQAGPQISGSTPERRFSDKTRNTFGTFDGQENPNGIGRSIGNVSRFFYCSKASREDRGPGNNHPTVKPQDLMKWLIRLVLPPTGGRIIDPFMGSGTTLVACQDLFVPCVGIEQEEAYCEIAAKRLEQGTLFQK